MEVGSYMSNSNLKNFDNFYANLAQSAYNGRPNNFPPKNNSKKFAEFNFSNDGYMRDKDGKITESPLEVRISIMMAKFTCSQIQICMLKRD